MNPKPLLDIEQAAHQLNVTPRFIRRRIAQRRIDYFRVSEFIRFQPDELDNWIQEQRVSQKVHGVS